MGSRVSLPTGLTSFSVISANAKAALRCRSTLSENESVVKAVRGDPEKKLVVVRSKSNWCQPSSRRKDNTGHTFEILQEVCNGFALVFQ